MLGQIAPTRTIMVDALEFTPRLMLANRDGVISKVDGPGLDVLGARDALAGLLVHNSAAESGRVNLYHVDQVLLRDPAERGRAIVQGQRPLPDVGAAILLINQPSGVEAQALADEGLGLGTQRLQASRLEGRLVGAEAVERDAGAHANDHSALIGALLRGFLLVAAASVLVEVLVR